MTGQRRSLAALYRETAASRRAEMADMRQLVLGYPDLAKRLTELPWPFSHPDRWSGHIPPYLFGGQRNDSPQRTALVAICHEALARKFDADFADRWLTAINHDPEAPRWTPHHAIEGQT